MSEEFNKDHSQAEAKLDEIMPPQETAVEVKAAPAARKNDPWKTAFIVLAGIAVISAGIFYTFYAKQNDLPMTPAVNDPLAQPVQMGNPPTGATEQAALAQPVPQDMSSVAPVLGPDGKPLPGAVGGDMYFGGSDPWANPGRFSTGTQPAGSVPFPVGPMPQPGQSTYMETNPNSPFMQDGNMYMMVPAPNANSAVNSNKAVPSGSPRTAGSGALPTPPPANSAVTNPPAQTAPATKPETKPADTKPAGKPATPTKRPTTGKPGTSSSKKPANGTEEDSN